MPFLHTARHRPLRMRVFPIRNRSKANPDGGGDERAVGDVDAFVVAIAPLPSPGNCDRIIPGC